MSKNNPSQRIWWLWPVIKRRDTVFFFLKSSFALYSKTVKLFYTILSSKTLLKLYENLCHLNYKHNWNVVSEHNYGLSLQAMQFGVVTCAFWVDKSGNFCLLLKCVDKKTKRIKTKKKQSLCFWEEKDAIRVRCRDKNLFYFRYFSINSSNNINNFWLTHQFPVGS